MWMMVNANGYALDAAGSRFDAVVIDGERIVAVGQAGDLRLQFGSRLNRVLDLAGATVVPGFVDSHLHVAGVGEQALKLNLFDVQSKTELLERVRGWRQHLPEGAWILGQGWNDNQFADRSLPSLTELDEAAGGHPMLLTRVCCHAYLANSRARELARLGTSPSDPADGTYGRDAAGQFNGQIFENASRPFFAAVPAWSGEDWARAVRAGMEQALRAGITAVHTDDVRNLQSFTKVWQTYHQLIHLEGVRLRVHELVDWHFMDECLQAAKELPAPDEWLEVGAAKLFSDGALGGRTAWFLDDYSDAPGWRGTPMYSREELCERVRVAHAKGFPAAVHAIGDAGLDATLAAMEGSRPPRLRDRIVHAEVINQGLLRRMVALGDRVVVDVQPRFTVSDFPWITERLGAERTAYACAWRTMKEAGLALAGGSDAPIEPIAPLFGIHAAVTRRKPYDRSEGYTLAQALTPVEALTLFARDACVANGSERQKGVIQPGWLADFTVLDRDIVNPGHADDIRDAQVRYTIVGGDIAYAADGTKVEWTA